MDDQLLQLLNDLAKERNPNFVLYMVYSPTIAVFRRAKLLYTWEFVLVDFDHDKYIWISDNIYNPDDWSTLRSVKNKISYLK